MNVREDLLAIQRELDDLEASNDSLRARVEALEAALKDCADDLEAEVRATHGADHPDGVHPSQVWKYERDVEPVVRARALLDTEEKG